MDNPIGFPDAAATLIAYISVFLTGRDTAEVHNKVPAPRPSRFVLIFRTGGPRHNLVVDGAQLTIECWDVDNAAAQDLAQLVRAGLFAAKSDVVGDTVLYGVEELAGPADLPDPQSNQSRMTWSVIALLRGTDLQPVP